MAASAKLSGGRFHQLNADEFLAVLRAVTPARRINAVHLHHTWKPRRSDYRGYDTIRGMWRFHTGTQGWSDIAQHLTIAPDGSLWTGRHWDLAPASAVGHNGGPHAGPFMIEMIGNFDQHEDPFDGVQKDTALLVLAALLERFELPTDAIRFHNEMSPKTCPGATIRRDVLLGEVDARRADVGRQSAGAVRTSPFAADADALFQAQVFLRGDSAGAVRSLDDSALSEPWDAEPLETDEPLRTLGRASAVLEAAAAARADVDTELTPTVKEALRPYVVNLTRGKLSTTGIFTTSAADIDLMFSTHLPKALADTQPERRPLRIVVYAHGGLNDERDGLGVALKHVHWWVRNGVYPIYFAWETGLLSSLINVIRSALDGARAARGPRDVFDFTDAQIEAAAREFKARSFWADMKHIAELAVAPGGGARMVAEKLAAFCQANAGAVEVHAIGHSAGSNFHGFFLPLLLDAGLPSVQTVQFLAPAITVNAFLDTLMRRIRQFGTLTMFTMKDTSERADSTAGLYRKSLLYLIHHALEEEREAPLLGLEKSVLDDIRLRRLFAVDGRVTSRNDTVVWSPGSDEDLAAASVSERHGGFDDDPFTMNSVLRRVLGLKGTDPVRDPFVAPATRRDVDGWSSADLGPALPAAMEVNAEAAFRSAVRADRGALSGRRRALCVGINAYRRNPLRGCVADAQDWARTLVKLGFEPPLMLLDQQATRERLLGELESLIRSSGRGDVVVFQYAGHGTTVPDRNSDELGGDSPRDDEALCPIDFTDGRLVIDDDLAALFRRIPEGVRVTSFIDACHSGSVSRLGFGGAQSESRRDLDERPRFIDADAGLIEAHLAFRAMSAELPATRAEERAAGRDTLFSACRSTEVAWESNGHGDFTQHATRMLAQGIAGMTHGSFLARVQSAFGANPRQHPEVYPLSESGSGLLIPEPGGLAGSLPAPAASSAALPVAQAGDIAHVLRAIADLLTSR